MFQHFALGPAHSTHRRSPVHPTDCLGGLLASTPNQVLALGYVARGNDDVATRHGCLARKGHGSEDSDDASARCSLGRRRFGRPVSAGLLRCAP